MGFYIQLFSPHGLIRGIDPEIGKDRDTGGQVKYVLELLSALSQHPEVSKVDLFTRRFHSAELSAAYSEEVEAINDKARIVRISCGPDDYLPKEALWDYLDEFTDNVIRFIQKEDSYPDLVHGHYADGNYIATRLSELFSIPMLATGHSLGRNKRELLLAEGLSAEKIEEQFNISHRIRVEEEVLLASYAVIVSTPHEIKAQYAAYDNFNAAAYHIIPPGINTEIFYPYYRLEMPGFTMPVQQELALHHVSREIDRFLFQPEKPFIMSIGRADKRKNFEAIIAAYGQDKELQAMANLVIFAGERNDISHLPEEEQAIFTNLLLLMDKYDLYGKMAIPKKNDPVNEIPEIYRLAARKRGIFVNATPGENFGLTILEAAACGLPVIADHSGGPVSLITSCGNGILTTVDVQEALANSMKRLISDEQFWQDCSASGIAASAELYSWDQHAQQYVALLKELQHKSGKNTAIAARLMRTQHAFVSDLDGTLIENGAKEGLEEIVSWISKNREQRIFGIATGRNKRLAMAAIRNFDLPQPDIMICAAGTEIYYGPQWIKDKGWDHYINYDWKPEEIMDLIGNCQSMVLQPAAAQHRFKISFDLVPGVDGEKLLQYLNKLFTVKAIPVQLYLTEGKHLDILPVRAGKGKALNYLSAKWGLPVANLITAGNGGNDIDMLNGDYPSIVVPGHDPALAVLKSHPFVYFSELPLSKGVYEGISYFATQQYETINKS
ncbi:MAG: HAD-IIB family hydrolase [Sphingobacteriales bacterium]|nr:MAG: HAD-IIB family hydrolase [Sphingobacteriales bacterium]